MLIRLFDEVSATPAREFRIPMKLIAINASAAVVCAVLALAWFGVAFAAGESPGPTPVIVLLILASIVLAVAIVGFVLGYGRSFPWLAIVLTPMFLYVVWALLWHEDVSFALVLGIETSTALFVGALAAWGLKHFGARLLENSLHKRQRLTKP